MTNDEIWDAIKKSDEEYGRQLLGDEEYEEREQDRAESALVYPWHPEHGMTARLDHNAPSQRRND